LIYTDRQVFISSGVQWLSQMKALLLNTVVFSRPYCLINLYHKGMINKCHFSMYLIAYFIQSIVLCLICVFSNSLPVLICWDILAVLNVLYSWHWIIDRMSVAVRCVFGYVLSIYCISRFVWMCQIVLWLVSYIFLHLWYVSVVCWSCAGGGDKAVSQNWHYFGSAMSHYCKHMISVVYQCCLKQGFHFTFILVCSYDKPSLLQSCGCG
jgi:hypothetical protein